MDYFIELLESYSKLKKRKLKLLIESSDPESLAKAELSAAQGMNPPPTHESPYIAQGVRAPVAIYFYQKKNAWHFAPVGQDGRPIIERHNKIEGRFYNNFVGYFRGEEEHQSQKKGKAQGGENILGSEIAEIDSEDASELAEIFAELQMVVPDAFSGIDRASLKKTKWGTPNEFSTYVFGRRKGSLESQVIKLRTRIEFDPKTNKFITSKSPSSTSKLKTISRKILSIFKGLSQDELVGTPRNEVESSIAINSDGTVSIFEDVDNSGLVFKDNSGFLKFIATALIKKFGLKFRKVDIHKSISTGLENVIRGTAMEKILPIFSLLKRKAALEALGHPGAKELDKLIKNTYKEVKEKFEYLNNSYQSWVTDFDESAMEPEDVAIIRQFSAIFGDEGKNLIASMYKASKDAIAIRKPDFILTKGEITGEGRRQDTLEIFNSFDAAKNALLSMGYSEEDITLNNMIKTGPNSLIFEGNEDTLDSLDKSKILDKNGSSFYISVSLKNYIDLEEAVFGTTTVSSNRAFIRGEGVDPEKKFLKKYQEITGQTPELHQRVIDYDQKLYDIGTNVSSLSVKSKTRNKSTGNLKDTSPFSDFIDSALSIVRSNSTNDELTDPINGDQDKKQLVELLDRYKDSEDDDEKSNMEDKIKQYTITLLKNKKLISDINKGDDAAKHYLAMKLFNTGGCVDDGIVCDYRGLGSGDSYNFNQNEVVKDVMNSFLNNDGVWDIRATGNNFIFFRKDNPKIKLMLTDKVEKRGSSTGDTFSTKSSCNISKQLMQHYDRKKNKKSAMESFIGFQKEFLEKLISLNEKVVIGQG